jgi:hypothetical protein
LIAAISSLVAPRLGDTEHQVTTEQASAIVGDRRLIAELRLVTAAIPASRWRDRVTKGRAHRSTAKVAAREPQRLVHAICPSAIRDPLRALGDRRIVGDDNGPHRLIARSKQIDDLAPGCGIEIAGRLVGQQRRGRGAVARAIATRCCSPPDNCAG